MDIPTISYFLSLRFIIACCTREKYRERRKTYGRDTTGGRNSKSLTTISTPTILYSIEHALKPYHVVYKKRLGATKSEKKKKKQKMEKKKEGTWRIMAGTRFGYNG